MRAHRRQQHLPQKAQEAEAVLHGHLVQRHRHPHHARRQQPHRQRHGKGQVRHPHRIGHAQPAQQLVDVDQRQRQHHGGHEQAEQQQHRHQPVARQQAARPRIGHRHGQQHGHGRRQQCPHTGTQQAGTPDRIVQHRHEVRQPVAGSFGRHHLQGHDGQPHQRRHPRHGTGRQHQPAQQPAQQAAPAAQWFFGRNLHQTAGQLAVAGPVQQQPGNHQQGRQHQQCLQQGQAGRQLIDRHIARLPARIEQPRQQPRQRRHPGHAARHPGQPLRRTGQQRQRPAIGPGQKAEEVHVQHRSGHQAKQHPQPQCPPQPRPLHQAEGRPPSAAIEGHRLVADPGNAAQPRHAQQRKQRYPLPQVAHQHLDGVGEPRRVLAQQIDLTGRRKIQPQPRLEQPAPAHHRDHQRREQHHAQQRVPCPGRPATQRQQPGQQQAQQGLQRNGARQAQRVEQQLLLHARVLHQHDHHLPGTPQRPRRLAPQQLDQHHQRQQPQQHQRGRAGQHQPDRKPALAMQCTHVARPLIAPAVRPRRKGYGG